MKQQEAQPVFLLAQGHAVEGLGEGRGAPPSLTPFWPCSILCCCRPALFCSEDTTVMSSLEQQHSCPQGVAQQLG